VREPCDSTLDGGFYLLGFTAIYAIYYGIRALGYSSRLPNKEGTGMAIGGIVLGAHSLLITIFLFALSR
jgi:hypothetical protein